MSLMHSEEPAVEALDGYQASSRANVFGPLMLLALCLLLGGLGGGAAAYGFLRYARHTEAAAAGPAPTPAPSIAARPAAATAPLAASFDPAPLQRDIAEIREALAELERATRLLPGAPAGEALRKRLESLEAAPRPNGPEQAARNLGALNERVAAMEGLAAERDRTLTAIQRHLKELDASYARLSGLLAERASAAEVQSLRAELTGLKGSVAANATQALAAGEAARAAFALAALSEAAQRSGPFPEQHKALAAALPQDADVAALAPLARVGAPSIADLQGRFASLETELDRALRQQEAGSGLIGGMQAMLAEQVSVRRANARETSSDRLEAASAAVQHGDLAQAEQVLGAFTGKPAAIAQPWLDGVRRRLEIEARLAAIRAKLSKG